MHPQVRTVTVAMVAFAIWSGASAAPAPSGEHEWAVFDQEIANSQKAMMADPNAALLGARTAEAIATQHRASRRHDEALATALWLEGEALNRVNRVDEARAAVAKASTLAARDGQVSKLDGDLALTRARIADSSGDFAGALKNYHDAHKVFVRLGIQRSQAIALLGLGTIYEKARDFEREVGYYRQAAQAYAGDPGFELSIANNIGFALQQQGRYGEAIDNYKHALKLAGEIKSPMLEARILTNIAMSQARQRKLVEAERAANKALSLLGPKDDSGWAPFVWGVKADIEYQRYAMATAVADLEKAFKGVDLPTTIAPFRDAHEIAYKVYRAVGNYPLSIAHLEAFKRLDDEGRQIAASANSALMSARFDFASQQLEIAKLKSAQLERDGKLKESRAATQRAILVGIILFGLILITWIAWRHVLVHRHRDELKRTLAERNQEIARRIETEAQLRVAIERAQEASRAKSQFLANMSHELRTPLNAIIGFSELMTVGRSLTPERVRDYAGTIAESGRNLLSVLSEILDMARLEAGRVTLADDRVALPALIDEALDALGEGRARVAVSAEEVSVCADRARLSQAVVNLLSNALKFTPGDRRIEVRTERVEDGVDIVIEDEGKGIPEEKLALVMEPFGQAESAYARSHSGVGLGLPIAKSLVELHGGRLTLCAGASGGTVARVHLPLSRVLAERARAVA
ncbi:MAG: tetratricopeptide repeat protein [Alphaproteobacteria bacterium]|nr:tetratricopeptide repeat protein [Alphaproteobacteria bacterium]